VCSIGCVVAAAQDVDVKVPAEVAPFVEAGTKAIAVESGDLNGDGRKDYVLVLHRTKPERDQSNLPANERPLLILIRGVDGKLSVAKRNEQIVNCSECGGAMGDPFQGVEVGRGTFTVSDYGGSAWRWSYEYKFNYSTRDKTWQLVRVKEANFNSLDPNRTMKSRVYIPPRDYGKIDIADFDPGNFLKKKPKTGR